MFSVTLVFPKQKRHNQSYQISKKNKILAVFIKIKAVNDKTNFYKNLSKFYIKTFENTVCELRSDGA